MKWWTSSILFLQLISSGHYCRKGHKYWFRDRQQLIGTDDLGHWYCSWTGTNNNLGDVLDALKCRFYIFAGTYDATIDTYSLCREPAPPVVFILTLPLTLTSEPYYNIV